MLSSYETFFIFLGIFVFVLCIAMSFLLTLLLIRARKRHIRFSPARKIALLAYLLPTTACIFTILAAIAFGRIIPNKWLDLIIIILPFVSLIGPIVAIELHSFCKTSSFTHCYKCGYDLTGNISGICPECGTPIKTNLASTLPLTQRIAAIGYKRYLLIYVLAAFFIFASFGFEGSVTGYYCSKCAKAEYRFSNSLYLYPTNIKVFTWSSPNPGYSNWPNPLTKYLDPDGSCQHNWLVYGGQYISMHPNARFTGLNPAANTVADEPDFDKFVEAHPDVIDRIRNDLANRRPFKDWLLDEYMTWKYEESNQTDQSKQNSKQH